MVGAGPNGLSAAVELARHGKSVLLVEARDTVGGGTRSEELTLPGFIHDVCSAIHPTGITSPFFDMVPLGEHGLEWVHPEVPLAHPLDDGSAAILARSVTETAGSLGRDAAAYRHMMEPLVADWPLVRRQVLGPIVRPPRHPLAMGRFGLKAMLPAQRLAGRFHGDRARALLAGLAAHSVAPLNRPFTAGVGLTLGIAGHVAGWPMARGGSQRIADALASLLISLGGEIRTGTRVDSLADLPPASVHVLDVVPRAALSIAGDRISGRRRSEMAAFRHGPGVFKVDWALDGPIPWANERVAAAGTVHVGGTLEEIAVAEADTEDGYHPERPFVLLAQQSLFDTTRAPAGADTAWAYCHVPSASTVDMTDRIEAQVERFAPGFRDRILQRHTIDPAGLELRNANLVGGDIAGGAITVRQLLARPTVHWDPYRVGDGVYLCSASTPPGAGVHGMCGYRAAVDALGDLAAD